MIIRNATTLDTDSSIQSTPVSHLRLTSELKDKSLIHIVDYLAEEQYQSMKMELKTFKQKVYESVNNTFKVDYWYTHIPVHPDENMEYSHKEISPYKEMIEYLDDQAPDDITLKENNLVEHINYDFELLRRYVDKKFKDIYDELNRIDRRLNYLDCFFYSEMLITTTNEDGDVIHESVNHDKTENNIHCQMRILDGNKISNEWIVPASGNLVIYGWLDSSDALNTKSIQSAFCVIEGKINSSSDFENWEIISVQPIIPAKSLTYVGFNLLVHKGLVIRARTGFTVGAKSYQNSKDNDGYDTLANLTPNGFRCQVFSHVNLEEE